MNAGIMDVVAAIKKYYQLATDEEAIQFYDKMKERNPDYPPMPITQDKKKSKFSIANNADTSGTTSTN